ncbi:hypothetical protein TVAG_204750 [Trichomonas vaginalis G3]|uniref:Uncharacterized protein n=1 Tax=Trichomonas vaginalis (strain ATCC PRA-98 / G3) TaxID=412133 RepID=A2EIX9_TRIV3|nr:hypothetical protein TVAGG3_0661490 [Trichomonas vaginalis G3]EAY07369.1 hypothetical protein TVAG_204750 [Trichomonas vaginalis G3]KAI5506522.1 hypothetical protein TVAGG3_0661490 [Trichomonas vaginalis G3]|eukprot:XP_001319592.1 hypothetical protein [Trichomonas vaginalis G3]
MHSFNFCLDQMNFSNAYEKRKKENVHIQLNIKSHCLFDKKQFLDNLVFDTNIVSTYNNTSELFDFKAKGQISDIKLYINPDFIFIINSFLPTIMKIITNEEFIKSFRRFVQTIKKLLNFKRETSFKLTYGTIQTVIGDENLGFGFNASLTPFVIKESPETGHIVKFGMKNVDLYSLLNLTEKSYTKIESIKTKFTKNLNIIQSKNITGNLSLRIYDLVRPILETIDELRKIGKVPLGFPDNKYMCKVENIDVNFLDYGHENVIFDIKIPKISMNLAGYTRALAIHVPSIVSNQGEKNIFEISELLFAYRMNESLKSVEMKTKDFYYKLLKEQILEPYEEVDINIPLFKISYDTLNFHFDKDFIPLIMNNLQPLKKYIKKIDDIPAIINEISQNIQQNSQNNLEKPRAVQDLKKHCRVTVEA